MHAVLWDLVLGQHDLPPSSPGPILLGSPAAFMIGGAAEGGMLLGGDNPLLRMDAEERRIHVAALVR